MVVSDGLPVAVDRIARVLPMEQEKIESPSCACGSRLGITQLHLGKSITQGRHFGGTRWTAVRRGKFRTRCSPNRLSRSTTSRSGSGVDVRPERERLLERRDELTEVTAPPAKEVQATVIVGADDPGGFLDDFLQSFGGEFADRWRAEAGRRGP